MKPQTQQQNLVVALLTSPWSILVSVGIAVFIGVLFKGAAAALRPFGQIYLYMIEMTVIPIIISAVVSSVAGLAKSTGVRAFLLRMIVVFVLMLVATSVVGTLAGIIGKPGVGLDVQTRNSLGAIVKTQQSQYAPDLDISLSGPIPHAPQPNIVDFLLQMVPRNIFEALSKGRALELIFFSIIFGVAVGVLGARQGSSLIDMFDGLFKAFQKIIAWLMVGLPVGLICLLADQIASTGFQILLAMLKFILIFYIVGIGVFIIDVLIIWRRSHARLGKVLKALLDPIVISLVTRSSFATLPTAIKSLTQKLGFFERSTNLFFSLGVTIGRFGNILYFALASIFVAQLYGAPLGLAQYGIVVVGSLFGGIATAGASGIATLNLLSIVLGPLGLPLEAVLIIFIAIDTIADPLRTMLIILTNMAANSLIVPHVDTLNRRRDETARAGGAHVEVEVDLLSRVRQKRELVVALESKDSAPFFYLAEDGNPAGIAIECAKTLAERLGVQLRLDRRSESTPELVTMLHEDVADLVAGPCNFHRMFESELRYSEPYATTREAMLADKVRLPRLKAKEETLLLALRSFTGNVGVVTGSIHEQLAVRLFPKAVLSQFATVDDLVDAVLSGEILAAFGNETELNHVLARRPTRGSSVSCTVFQNLLADFRFGVSPRYEKSLSTINEIVGTVRANEKAVLPA